jgi:hypothetical protein
MVGMVVGITLGCVFLIAAVSAAVWFMHLKKTHPRAHQQLQMNEPTLVQPSDKEPMKVTNF